MQFTMALISLLMLTSVPGWVSRGAMCVLLIFVCVADGAVGGAAGASLVELSCGRLTGVCGLALFCL